MNIFDAQAAQNFAELARDPYPGRGIVIGMDETGKYLVQIYWIMGRSKNSRNRVFEKDTKTGRVWTAARNPKKVKDPSLIIYTAMNKKNDVYIVSNGVQTDSIAKDALPFFMHGSEPFRKTLSKFSYEPDPPNNTPRISAACFIDTQRNKPQPILAEMSIIKRWSWSINAQQIFYPFAEFRPGFGLCMTTYSGSGDPLPSFDREPYVLPVTGDIKKVAKKYWAVLNKQNRISLAVKFIKISTGKSKLEIINRYKKIKVQKSGAR